MTEWKLWAVTRDDIAVDEDAVAEAKATLRGEAAAWRDAMAEAWELGYIAGASSEGAFSVPGDEAENPYRDDTPEPVECPDCWGTGTTHIYDGHTTQTMPCDRCLGDGAVEPDA